MGRPLRTRETIYHHEDFSQTPVAVEKTGVIGNNSLTGEQIILTALISQDDIQDGSTLASAQNTSNIEQKGSKKFKCTTSDGAGLCILVPVAPEELNNEITGQCQLTVTDSDGGTYYVSKIVANWVYIGKLGTGSIFAVSDRVQWVDDQTPAHKVCDINTPDGQNDPDCKEVVEDILTNGESVYTTVTQIHPIGHVLQLARIQVPTS
jgi:hypothetical protein